MVAQMARTTILFWPGQRWIDGVASSTWHWHARSRSFRSTQRPQPPQSQSNVGSIRAVSLEDTRLAVRTIRRAAEERPAGAQSRAAQQRDQQHHADKFMDAAEGITEESET
jgi:hypothetical protein